MVPLLPYYRIKQKHTILWIWAINTDSEYIDKLQNLYQLNFENSPFQIIFIYVL